MWKNVSRRLKDGWVERLGKTVVSTSPNSSSPLTSELVERKDVTRLHFDGQRRDEDEKKRFKCKFGQRTLHHTWLGALTWSSAIICGWYTSQLLCLKSRRRHVDCDLTKSADEYRCKYYKLLLVPSRVLHSGLLSKLVFNAPGQPQQQQHYSTKAESPVPSTPSSGYHSQHGFSSWRSKFNSIAENDEFNNQNFSHIEEVVAVPQSGVEPLTVKPDPVVVATAVQNLLSVLGEMEYEMGVQNILNGNYGTAVEQLKQGAFHRHPGATFNLGLCFEQGLGCAKSMEKAAECYQEAARLGHKKAMYNLAIFYLKGLGGLEQDRQMARRYFEAAANLGLPEARRALAPITVKPHLSFLERPTSGHNNSLVIT